MQFQRKAIFGASLLGALAVVLGAFGAHGLKTVLSDTQLGAYQTGITYHFYHVLAIFVGVWLSLQSKQALAKWAVRAFFVGIFLFSGSLYLLSCKDLLGLGSFQKILGPITPIGGLFFIIGWVLLAISALKWQKISTKIE